MSSFSGALLLVLFAAGVGASTVPDEDFFRDCAPARCSAGGLEVRFPLRLNTSSPVCGAPGLDLYCSGGDIILELPSSGNYKVTGIDYTYREITIDPGKSWSRCSPQSLPPIIVNDSRFYARDDSVFTIVNCSVEIATDMYRMGSFKMIHGPIRCLSSAGHFAYAAEPSLVMDSLPPACEVVSTGYFPRNLLPPTDSDVFYARHREGAFYVTWYPYDGCVVCMHCEAAGGRCGLSRRENTTVCYGPPSRKVGRVVLIAGTSSAGVVAITAALVYLYITKKSNRAKETRLKVEKFLADYRTTKPTRYSYGDIKKMTRRFRHKLGQGGFGSVYKGELPNGVPVAVKMLDKSMGDGEEFINEVATTGRIHHVNVVRLLGFFSEGPRRALVYEFMPNESLEKFIFSKDGRRRRPSSWERLEEIAVGIARGIEYLHRGCSERILHFDIKPHNILLDHNFNPKISDFGLAKLCSKDQSIVSMTAARGTMGYIAPEIYSRNFGSVSCKSDVYSFGMLLMEMISGRKSVEPTVETSGQIYLPEHMYDRLVRGEELACGMEMEGKEEIARKLAVVALWCIQWNPGDRPSMTRVVQMLTGGSQGLQIPSAPPFVSCSMVK